MINTILWRFICWLRKATVSLFFLLFVFVINTQAQFVPVLEPAGGFHIDGNLNSNTPVDGVGDWVEGSGGSGGFVFFNDGTPVNPLRSQLAVDAYDGNDIIFQGSKFNDNPATWSWTTGKASSKNDINNVMYHLATDASNNTWVILGSDRFSNNGTSYIDFEFFQNTVSRNPVSGFHTEGPHGGRTVNDLVVSMEYTDGGSSANLRFYLWQPVGSGYDYVEQTIPPTVAYGASNTVPVDVPFGAFGSTTYAPYTFVEAAVNISELFGAINPCIGINVKTILVKTKASASMTANLGDFVEPIQVELSLGTANISYINGDSLCPSGTASVELSGVSGGAFSATPAGLIINSTTGEIDMSASTPGTYTITYDFITAGCPRSVTTDVTIIEMPEPPLSASSDLTLLCSDHSGHIILTATGGSGTTLRWYKDGCNTTLVGTGNNLSVPAPTQTTTYYAAWENSCGTSSCAEVVVEVLPELQFNAAITTHISAYNASDAEITITASGGNGDYTYALDGGSPQTSSIFSGLSHGTYSITVYDSHGCQATDNIIIPNALEIIATNDTGTVNGMTGGTAVANVLDNDSLNGAVVNAGDIIITQISASDPQINLIGTSVEVDAATAAGTYTLVYQICEAANTTNCAQAEVLVIVEAADIIAEDDIVTGINGYMGAMAVINVFDNDLLNGNPVNPLDVTLAETVPDPNAFISLNADGTVDVASATPAGTYTLTYEICEVLNPGNCDDAIVSVTVEPASIVAVDDTISNINGTTGVNNVLNVFDNDSLNGSVVIPSEVELSIVTPNASLTLNADGSVDVAPFTAGGIYTLTYQICEVLNPANCDQAVVTIEVFPTSDLSIVKSHIDPSNLPVGSDANLITIAPSEITAGTKIYYYLRVDNFGPDNSFDALIEDYMPSEISNTEYSLNLGNSWFPWAGTRYLQEFLYPGFNTILLRGDVSPSATGSFTNTASIYSPVTFDPDLSNNESTVVTQINSSADLMLSKQVKNAPIIIDEDIIYEVIVFNNGPSNAPDVVIEDIIDPAVISNVTYSLDSGATWLSPWSGSVNIGTLAYNEGFALQIKGTVVNAFPDPNVNPIPNTASVTSPVHDPDMSNNTETILTPLNLEADVSIVKTGPPSVVAGESIVYTITVTNNSATFDAENVSVSDNISASYVINPEYSVDAGASWSPWTGNYNIGTLSPLQSVEILISGDVLSSVTGVIPNTATVSSATPDPDQSNNSSTINTPVEVIADLDIFKIQIDPSILPLDSSAIFGNPMDYVIDPVTITAGESIYYVLFYGNNGPSDATNVIIDDVLPPHITNIEASRCQANYGP